MRAMILAAGRGERMRPLTDTTPKPLLHVGGKPLIVWHIERLVAAGFQDIIINHAWLGMQIEHTLGSGKHLDARLHYSAEDTPLETAGGIAKALPFFKNQPFLVVNGDIWCDWDPAQARASADALRQRGALAWLLLVNNPPHHPDGDFVLTTVADVTLPGLLSDDNHIGPALTFSGIGVYCPELFANVPPHQPVALAPLLRTAMEQNRIIGARHHGDWIDVGTPERLNLLDQRLARRAQARYTSP